MAASAKFIWRVFDRWYLSVPTGVTVLGVKAFLQDGKVVRKRR